MARTPRNPRTESSNDRPETNVDTGDGTEITVGVDWGSVSAAISSKGVLTLGIGIAEVEYNFADPYESTVSYAFGLYTIDGRREGCTVILDYYFAGVFTHSETRTVPECEEPEPKPEPEPDPDPQPEPDDNDPDNWNETPDREFPNDNNIYEAFLIFEQKKSYTNLDTGESFYGYVKIGYNGLGFNKNRKFSINAYGNYTNPNPNLDLGFEGRTPLFVPSLYTSIVKILNRSYKYNIEVSPFTLGGDYGSWNGQLPYKTSWEDPTENPFRGVVWVRGRGVSINAFIKVMIVNFDETHFQTSPKYRGAHLLKFKNYVLLEVLKFPEINNPPPAKREKNTMDDRCCLMIEQIYAVLDIDELLNNGFEVSNRLIATDATGYQKLETYLQILEFQLRMQDHLGIHPFLAEVTDYNAAQEGNQKMETKSVNATAFAKQITELLLENKGDSATRLNLMVRTAIAVGQIFNMVAICTKRVREIMRFLGMPVKEKSFDVPMPFDFTFGKRKETKGKGFNPEPNKKATEFLNINTEEATEALLPKFMQNERQPIVVEMYDDREPNLIERINGDTKL